jgi:hypothetical protein
MGLFKNIHSVFSTSPAQGIVSRVAAQAQAQQAQQPQQGRNLASFSMSPTLQAASRQTQAPQKVINSPKSTPQQGYNLAPFSYGPRQQLEMGPTSTPRKATPTYVPTLQEMSAQAQSQEKAYRDSMAELQRLQQQRGYKKGGQVKVAQDTKKKYTSGGKINLNECSVSTAQKGKTNSNW